MIKDFGKSRVSLINIYNSFKKGAKQAYDICKSTHISLTSSEGKRMLMFFCLDKINKDCRAVKTNYSKVLYVAQEQIEPKFQHFLEVHMPKLMKKSTFPYCGIYNTNSPDLEFAALQNLKPSAPKKTIDFFRNLGVKRSYIEANNEPSFSPKG